jgi:glycine/D-amino acid oxidase-like deaminating enzyme
MMPAGPRPALWQLDGRWAGFPPLGALARADAVVIGAGVTGAACAGALAERGASVLLLEAAQAAAGASGRNGGFASAGTGLELPEAAALVGETAALALHRATEAALEAMQAIAATEGERDAVRRTGSLWLAGPGEAGRLRATVAALAAAGVACGEAPELIPEPMRVRYTHAAHVPGDCALQPARWVRALVGAAARAGARVHEGSPASAIGPAPGGWRVTTPSAAAEARTLVVATDGLLPRLVPELRGIVYPVRGQMLATARLAAPPLAMPTHFDHGFVYAQPTREGRIVLGGARWADLEAEYTADPHPTPPVQRALDRVLAERLGLAGVEVTHRWAGIMGFSADLLPVAGELPGRPGRFVAGGYSGVGNVQGFVCGRMLADLIGGAAHPLAAPLAPGRFAHGDVLRPPPRLREREESRGLLAALV